MYTIKEAAEKLDVSAVTLRRYIKQGKLAARKVGKEYQIAEEDVDALQKGVDPVDPVEIINSALETNKEYPYEHQRSDAFGRASKLLRERGDVTQADVIAKDALIFGYRLVVQASAEKSKDSNRGRFSPRMTGKDSTGKDAAWPDPALIDDELVAHAKMRADSVKNPFTKAVYSDMVYEFSKNADRPKYGRQAAEEYLLAADVEPEDDENFRFFNVQSYILRALELALALKDDALFQKVVQFALDKMGQFSVAGKPRILLEIIKVLLSNSKKLSAGDISRIEPLIDSASAYYFKDDNQHLARSFIELKKLLPDTKSSADEQKKVQRQLYDSFMQEAEAKAGSGMVAAHFYSEALKIGNGVLTPEEQAALRRKIEEANLQGESEMKQFTFDFRISNEEIKQYVDAVLVDDIEKSLIRIALLPGMIPSVARAEETAKKMMKEFPVSHMFSTQSLQDGRVVAITGGGLEVSEDHILSQLAQEINLHGLFLGFLFGELKRRGLDAQQLAAYLSQRDFFDNETLPAVSEALSLYFDGKYYSTVTVLLPQLEQILRLANRKLGLPTLRSRDSGEQRVIYLQEALEALKDVFDAFSPDAYQYFCLLLWDKRGPGLRDTSAHGLLEFSSSNRHQANLLIQLLLILALFEYKKTSE